MGQAKRYANQKDTSEYVNARNGIFHYWSITIRVHYLDIAEIKLQKGTNEMKTKNFKRHALPKSKALDGVGNYNRTALLGIPAYKESAKRLFALWKQDALDARNSRKADRQRQKLDRNLNWSKVHVLLSKGHSLETAKEIVRGTSL